MLASQARATKSTVTRMQADNARENRPITTKRLMKMMRQSLAAARPELSAPQLDLLVAELLPKVLRPYQGEPMRVTRSPTARDLADAERKRVVKANAGRRR